MNMHCHCWLEEAVWICHSLGKRERAVRKSASDSRWGHQQEKEPRLKWLYHGVRIKSTLAEVSPCRGDSSLSSCSRKRGPRPHPLRLPSHKTMGTKRGSQLEMTPNRSSGRSCLGWALQSLGDTFVQSHVCTSLLGLSVDVGWGVERTEQIYVASSVAPLASCSPTHFPRDLIPAAVICQSGNRIQPKVLMQS